MTEEPTTTTATAILTDVRDSLASPEKLEACDVHFILGMLSSRYQISFGKGKTAHDYLSEAIDHQPIIAWFESVEHEDLIAAFKKAIELSEAV